jgi:uncharacterized cupin superfamily protein
VNLRAAELTVLDDLPAGFRHRRVSVREALGGEDIGCSLYELDPGEQLWPYHVHWNNDEWLLVVGGTPTLRTPDGERELRTGDLVSFPEGETGAHTVYNRSDEPVRLVVFATRNQGSVDYPDSGKVGAGPPWDRLYFKREAAVDYWEGEKTAT